MKTLHILVICIILLTSVPVKAQVIVDPPFCEPAPCPYENNTWLPFIVNQ